MDTATEDLTRSDVDAEMTVLTSEDITGQNMEASDEVEILRNSLREALHDDNVRPKMQCLMMDSSFSMVTMQGEDSGIAWETTPSRCTTPWASEAGNPAVELGSPVSARAATPGSHPAGKIIFVMDEELISRRKKTKERVSGQKSKADRRREVLEGSSENISGRRELVEVSQPNVKTEGEGDPEEPAAPVDKEQQLFRLVSEGSEILNIVVPPKLATVDEEESKDMVDNLSYLEESPVFKASEESHDYELLDSTRSDTATSAKPSTPAGPEAMDPPGAPVARPPGRRPAANTDYFEAFALIDAQAPGSSAVVGQEKVEPEAEAATEGQDTETPVQVKENITTNVDNDNLDRVSLEEITSELLDEVFYGGTDDYLMKSLDSADRGGRTAGAPVRLPSKPSGSNLFGSQEEILTPIFLPDGPPKMIDPILLEEPKAMAFLYTDLYEEAIGSRQKEEDTESMRSEKSFHSRHSDREARGYLEKYVLIDETPVVEVEAKEKHQEEGPRILSQDLYNSGDFLATSEKGETTNSEEEITDFFRSSGNSSPCDIEPFVRSVEEDDTQTTTKSKAKKEKSVSIAVDKVAETPADPLSVEFPSDEPDWGSTDDHPLALDEKDVTEHTDQKMWKQDSEIDKPVAPPRKKTTSSPKASLDLTPLTPVDLITQEQEEAGGKEQRVEEKETASPAETADEGDGDAEETMETSSEDALSENMSSETERVKDSDDITVGAEKPAEETDAKTEEETKQTELEEENVKPQESDETEINAEKQGDTSTDVTTEPDKNKGQCIIL